MHAITVRLAERPYTILVGPGALSRLAGTVCRERAPTRVAIITHPRLAALYAGALVRDFAACGLPATVLHLPPGERAKRLRAVERLCEGMLRAGLDRKSLVVALGGGVVGDVAGFAAAVYMRGIPVVQAPTTLLAQVDASIGGKTGVDLAAGKNLVGAFHQPRAVFADTETLRTLPLRELRSGLAEVVKYGVISEPAMLRAVREHARAVLARRQDALLPLIVRSCEIKAEVVAEDETEQGRRVILNFGHTIGHALEAVTQFRRFLHGEAVAIGMMAAALVGEHLGITPKEVTRELEATLRPVGLPSTLPSDIPIAQVLAATRADKKAASGGVRYVLARNPGNVELVSGVADEAVIAALERLRDRA